MSQNVRFAISTLERKLYQILIAALDGDRIAEEPYQERIFDLARSGIGGFIISGGEREELRTFLRQIGSYAPLPLFIASDVERGMGGQVRGATLFPGPMAFAAAVNGADCRDHGLVEKALSAMAAEIADCGINMPVICPPDKTSRAVKPAAMAETFAGFRAGLRTRGLFPLEKDGPLWDGTGHAYSFTGTGSGTDHGLSVFALGQDGERQASRCMGEGADMLIPCVDPEAAVADLARALRSGAITEGRIDEAVARIARVKSGIRPAPGVPADYALGGELSGRVAQAAITLVKGRGRFFPVRDADNIPLIYGGDRALFAASPLRYYVKQASHVKDPLPTRERPVMFLLFPPTGRGNGPAPMESGETESLKRLMRGNSPAIVVSFGSPYVLNQFKEADVLIAAYDATVDAQDAVFRCITGERPFQGELPVELEVPGGAGTKDPGAP